VIDTLTSTERSKRMGLVRSKDTKPELMVRRLTHRLGYRYRLHEKKLPGCPDLVFKGRKKVIFVHGCFWHRHKSCKLARWPKTRLEFWVPKLENNKKRDAKNQKLLQKMGWSMLIVWECEINQCQDILERKILNFLGE